MISGPSNVTSGLPGLGRPISRCGIGLREPHLRHILDVLPDVPWFELLTDNYLQTNGPLLRQIDNVRRNYPLTFHGVGMSLGSADPLDEYYLTAVKHLIQRYEPAWVSDHLAFTHIGDKHFHDLLPIPYTDEALQHVSQRIEQVQDFLGQELVVENVSSYLQYKDSTYAEAEFITELVQRTGCKLLLDINNVYVNAFNHGFDAYSYLEKIPFDEVNEIHLGGHEDRGDYLLDAHNNEVTQAVWALYESVMKFHPDIPTLIEWDNALPEFDVLLRQADIANDIVIKEHNVKADNVL